MSTMKTDISLKDYPSNLVSFIEKDLSSMKVDKRLKIQAMLLSEEVLVKLKEYGTAQDVTVNVRKHLGNPYIDISMPGEEFDEKELVGDYSDESAGDISEDSIRSIILHAYGEHLKYRHKNKVNHVRIEVDSSNKKSIYYTVFTMAIALVLGLLFNFFVPHNLNAALCHYIFVPVKTVFINSLKMIVAPVVFFSIVTCLSQFGDIRELGRIGAKVMGMYLTTTVFAIAIGFGVFYIFDPGTFGSLAESVSGQSGSEAQVVAPSIIDTIVNIVPSNIVEPFANSDTLQLIFLAILCGIAVGTIGSYSMPIKNLFEAFNSLFLAIVSIITKFIPVAVFASIFILIVETGTSSLGDVLAFVMTFLAGIVIMMLVYSVLIIVMARLNPLKFFSKNLPGMINAFTLSSSNASMPANIDICENSMGISKKVCQFSIPLGATVNMDGFCVFLPIVGLFLAKMYGVVVPTSSLVSVAFMIVMLSVSSPGIPGVDIICISILLGIMNVPAEAVGVIMGVDALLDMVRTVSNTTGDIAVSLIVARSENLVDLEKWK